VTKPTDSHLFARLWRSYLKRYWPLVIISTVLMVIEGSTLGALSYMLEPMFDQVFVAGRADMIVWVGAGIFGLFVLRAVAGVTQRILMSSVSFRASSQLQQDLLGHCLRLDNVFFQTHPPGMLIERVQGDVMAIQNVWNVLLMGAGRDLVALISLMIVAVSVDPLWTLVAIVGAPLLLGPSFVVQRYIRKKGTTLRNIAGRRTTRLDEIFHGITPIKLNTMEAYQQGRFNAVTQEHITASVKSQAGHSAVPGLVDIAVGLGFFAVMLYGGQQIIDGEKSIGEFMSFFTAMALAFQPLRRLAGVAGYYQTMMASLERIYDLLDTYPTITSPAVLPAAPADMTIRFEDVSLSYGDAPVLRGLSFEAYAGQTTALVGLSGAGKSTVFNALTRLADPQSGRITLGGQDIADWPLHDLRAMFSVVSQDTLLFDETLRENILMGRLDVPEARLTAALDAAHVSDFLADLPAGLDSPAGPRGSNLSGGQRQRVAIARALLRDTPLLLLDEATSALDVKSETLVQAALEQLASARTTLVIAHRLSTIRNADKILVLNDGLLAESGTHDELMAKGGLYTQLNALQFQKQDADNAP
jgi:subfamily B ATP-binding cassette protein MsbA